MRTATNLLRLTLPMVRLALSLMLAMVLTGVSHAQENKTLTTPAALSENDVESALNGIRSDPNIHAEITQRILRWQSSPKAKDTSGPSSWSTGWQDAFSWIIDLFQWLAEFSRMLVWLIIAALAGALMVLVLRIVRHVRSSTTGAMPMALPTHIQNLDIRPETLPDDIGAAAWQLWQSGNHREALALLYRAALSRLVNVHGVPIKASSTEADCLRLCKPVLRDAPLNFTGQLIGLWQQASYGDKHAAEHEVQRLCQDFSAMLDKSASAGLSS